MKPVFACSLTAALAVAVLGSSTAMAQTSSNLGDMLKGAVTAPSSSSKAPAVSTRFTPVSADRLFLDSIAAKLNGDETKKAAFRKYADQIITMVEGAYTSYGFPKNDVGVAFGGLLETCYELDKGTYKTTSATEQDKQKTRAAVLQVQRALGSVPAFAALPARNKQTAYESATFLMGNLAVQWQQAGSDAAKKEVVRQMARQQIQTLFKIDPDGITRLASGAFTSKSGRGSVASANTATKSASGAAVPVAVASKGPLPAASLGGARIFIKYRIQYSTYMETKFDHLILFPDGTAFDDIPSKPMPNFGAATLKSMLKPFYIGTWKQSGNTIVLNFPNETRDKQRVLLKHPKGWYDGKALPKKDSAYDIYYPVIMPTKQHLVGAWKSSSLTTMGFAGGGAPMVAAGSNQNRVFRADGTFAGDRKSFASATTANMGDAFKSGGDVTTTSNSSKNSLGRWRLDGPLLTLEQNGQRTVHIAFIMPNWSSDPKKQSDIMIDGDNWEHPDK